MKIALVSNTAWSLVNFRSGLIGGLRASGHEVTVIAPRDDSVPRLLATGARYRPVWLDNQGTNPAFDLWSLLELLRLFRDLRSDVAILYTVKPVVYASAACRLLGVPYIAAITGLGSAYLRGGWLARLLEGLWRLSLRRAHRVMFFNEDDRALFLRKGLVRPESARLLPGEGIDVSHFSPVPAPALDTGEDDGLHFTFVGRLLRDKGVMEFVDAARIVKARHPEARFSMLGFIGARNPSAVDRAQVDAWVHEGVVSYLGTAQDVRGHLAQASCIVLPSYREGASRVLLEAMAMARPVIASDVSGCRHLVADGRNGLLCRPRDAGDLGQFGGGHASTLALPMPRSESGGHVWRQKKKAPDGTFSLCARGGT